MKTTWNRPCVVPFVSLVLPLLAQTQPRRTLLLRIDNVRGEQLRKIGFPLDVEQPRQTVVSLVRDTAMVLATRAEVVLCFTSIPTTRPSAFSITKSTSWPAWVWK